jgi:HSP20 family protein
MANITRFDPFAEIQALQKQVFGDDWFTALPSSKQQPTTDVYTVDDNHMIIEAYLPHFSEDDVNINIENGMLEIQAEKSETLEDSDKKKYVVRESSSSFYRRIRLPDQADTAHIEARMDDGILKITVPFKKLPTPKRVTISRTGRTTAKNQKTK